MQTTASRNQTGDESSSSSPEILNLLISDFLQPLKPTSSNSNNNKKVVRKTASTEDPLAHKINASGKILVTIVRNALRSHQSENYRKIRLGNKKIQSMVVTVPYAMDLLTAVGFVYAEMDGEKYMMFPENDKNIATANFFCSTMDEELKNLEPPAFALGSHNDNHSSSPSTAKSTASISPANTATTSAEKKNKDIFLSEKERKERTMKVKAAKRAKRIEKDLAIQRWEDDKRQRIERQQRDREKKAAASGVVGKHNNNNNNGGGQAAMDIAPNIHSRKLHHETTTSVSIGGTAADQDQDESLESLRAKAANAWHLKQQKESNNGISSDNDNDSDNDNYPVAKETVEDAMDVAEEEEDTTVVVVVDDDRKLPATTPKLVEAQEFLDQITLSPEYINASKTKTQTQPSLSWEEALNHIPRCGPAADIRETSIFNNKKGSQAAAHASSSTSTSSTHTCLKRLFSEFEELKTSLPSDKLCSAWLRFDEEAPQYIRAILTAPLPGPSPYSGGIFAFDIWIPDNYPNVAPKCEIITTGRGSVRFGPNLYACGKVCLSLLGTWEGPKWNPKKSSLFQVLVSIQSLMLGSEHPFFLEPGHGGWEEKVKEGDFMSVGKTLSGDTVQEELKLPPHAWLYEDTIRVGTVRYAMLEPLQMVVCKNKKSVNPALAHLLPFEDIIKLHFTHNGANTLGSVADWINASRPSTIRSGGMTRNLHLQAHAPPSRQQKEAPSQPYPAQFDNSLNILYHQFEAQLKKLSELKPTPSTTALNNGIAENDSPENLQSFEEATTKPLAENASASSTNNSTNEGSDLLRLRMKEAAESGNFILAGQIQKEIQESESFDQKVADLNAQIKEAASEGDYIRAGNLQANLKRLQSKTANSAYGSSSDSSPPSTAAASQMYSAEDDEEMEYDDDNDNGDDGYNDDGYDENGYDGDGYVHSYNGSHKYSHTSRWGTGHRLNDDTTTAQSDKTSASTDNVPPVSRLVVKDSRKIRIRLPTSSLVMEEFDSNEKLAVVYKVVKSHMIEKGTQQHSASPTKVVQLRGLSDASGKQKVELSGGAFAVPISEFGFTLLSAHPKREYSLEMDGTKALKDLDIAASATLTVMMCNARGQVKRGLLENKLAGAQGDAMDVEDLNYEALQELGEKIGVAAPGDGVWKGIDQKTLEEISTVLSPKDYLAQKSTGDGEGDSKCCICLGEFDPTETDPQLRVLNHCSHVFHSACLQTWLSTKTNCPVCKHSLTE